MFDFLAYIPLIGEPLTFIVPFVIVLSIVIFIHEYGHYIVGRWCGIHAEAFSMGFGPVLKSWVDKRGTRWQISALPLGGYVKFLGDANAASGGADHAAIEAMPEELRAKTLEKAALWKRALTVFAGPGINFVASFFIFAGVVLYSGVPTGEPVVGTVNQLNGVKNDLVLGDRLISVDGVQITTNEDFRKLLNPETFNAQSTYVVERDGKTIEVIAPYPYLPAVGRVMPAQPAARAGVKKGDIILQVGDSPVRTFSELRDLIIAASEDRIPLVVQRGSEQVELTIRPRKSAYVDSEGQLKEKVQIGVQSFGPFEADMRSVGPIEALKFGAQGVWGMVTVFGQTISKLVTGAISPKNLNGPLGIAVASGDTASQGLLDLIQFVAVISTAIGLMNLLPIPVLDGGHLVIYAYQAVFKRPPNEKVLNYVMLVGFSLLITLVLYATFYDGVRLLG